MNKRVLVVLANNCEEGEVVEIIDVMRRAGFDCDGVSIENDIIRGQHKVAICADIVMGQSIEEFKNYDALVLPGGWGASDTMKSDPRILELTRYYFTHPDKYLAAMCAAPAVLAAAEISEGRTITSYPGPKLEPLFKNANYVSDTVAFDCDKHLITSRGPATALPFAFAIVDSLGGDSTEIKRRFLYNELKDYPDKI